MTALLDAGPGPRHGNEDDEDAYTRDYYYD